jgi:hypothetical protein
MKQYPHVIVDIFENGMYPVVSHIFYGKTIEEAREYFKAHMKTDSFLRSAVHTGYFKNIRVKVGIAEKYGD